MGPLQKAHKYRAAGWTDILWLPPRAKSPVPKGYTGRNAKTVDDTTLNQWLEMHPDGNIGVHLPDGFIGLDVDNYDGKNGLTTLLSCMDRFGPLPPTWKMSSRSDGISGIRVYRTPKGLRWPGEIGPNVEVVQASHRYMVAWPSVHPETGQQYSWFTPEGTRAIYIPGQEDPANLPDRWVQGLTGGELAGEAQFGEGFAEWIEEHGAGEMCRHMEQLAGWEYEEGARHEAFLRITARVLYAAQEGHSGAEQCLDILRGHFEDVKAGEATPGEWARYLNAPAGECHDTDPCEEPFAGLIDTPMAEITAALEPPASKPAGFWSGVLSVSDLANLPQPKPLIKDTLDLHTTAFLAGQWGTYKSFVALSWALSIATGTPWMGRDAQAGKVLYIVAEGAYGMKRRIDAWSKHHGIDIQDGNLVIYPKAAQLSDTELMQSLREGVADFSLVIVDTFAKSTVGMEENSSKDMGRMFAAADSVREAMTAGTVLMVHHQGYDSKKPTRGSTSLPGAVDTIYTTEGKEDRRVTLTRKKRKDGPEEDRLTFEMTQVDLGKDDNGDTITSIVPVLFNEEDEGVDPSRVIMSRVSKLLAEHPEGLTATAIYAQLGGNKQSVVEACKNLIATEFVVVQQVGAAKLHKNAKMFDHLMDIGEEAV